jgi:anti-sigma factor RsiW
MYKFTPEDLLQYLYNEKDSATKALMEEALANDWTLREKLAVLKASQERLNRLMETPRTEAVLNILKYAATTQKVTS